MGELGAFLKLQRQPPPEREPAERVRDHREFVKTLPLVELRQQGARCMECGVPFCHHGCPLGNLIPDWNDLVYRDRFEEASEQLHRTNNFPEFTGRLCPAPCEAACVLEIDEGNAVTIKQIELAIVDRAWDEGWIVPQPPRTRSGATVAVVGSGPAGLACAQELNRSGHRVTVFERDEAGGGLLRFGVPDFKIEKTVVERRLAQLEAEGVVFEYGVEIAEPAQLEGFDAVVLATGARVPRDLPVPGRELDGVHFALEYLYQRNRAVAESAEPTISAAGKHVIVIGGGDTGADCVASAHRESARAVTQIELLGEPSATRPDALTPWPLWPAKLRTSYALKEGGTRSFAISTVALEGDGRVERRVSIRRGPGQRGDASGGSRAARDGLHRARARATRRASHGRRRAWGDPRVELRDIGARDLRRRGRETRPVTHRLGDRGGAPLRRGGRRLAGLTQDLSGALARKTQLESDCRRSTPLEDIA
ncbi:MAG: glutamate synthase subunit beta [Gaiellaceae bacterium]